MAGIQALGPNLVVKSPFHLTVQELLGQNDASTIVIYSRGLKQEGRGVKIPLDHL